MSPVRRPRVTVVVVVVVAAALAVGGCGVPEQQEPTSLPVSQVPYGLTAPTAGTARATASAPGGPEVYLVGPDGRLVPRGRPAAAGDTRHRLDDLLVHLAAGPTAEELGHHLSSDLGPGLRLRVPGMHGSTTTVDLGATDELPTGRNSRLAVAQIVLTATSLPGVDAVVLTRGADRVEAPLPDGQLSDRPVTAADYAVLVGTTTPPS